MTVAEAQRASAQPADRATRVPPWRNPWRRPYVLAGITWAYIVW